MSDLYFSNTQILVTGGAGFVGSNLVQQLLAHEPRKVIIVDNLLSSDIGNIPDDPRIEFIFGSIADERILHHLSQDLDFVFHLACYHGNQSSIHNPLADHENNTLTSLKLFDHIKSFQRLQKVVYASAACAVAKKTYDQPDATTEAQSIELYHDSPYSISKVIGELYGNYYFQRYQMPLVKARFSNVYGPKEILGAGQWRGTAHTVWRNVIPSFIWRALHNEALPLDNAGQTSRDFIFVEDIVKGLIACAQKGQVGETYNLATGQETCILDVAKLINELTGNETPVDLHPARAWDRSGKRFAATQKSTEQLDFTATVNLHQGIKQTIAWTKMTYPIIQANIARHRLFMHRDSQTDINNTQARKA